MDAREPLASPAERLGAWIRRRWQHRRRGPGVEPVHVGDPRFDDWESVGFFERVEVARAFWQSLDEAGYDCAMTTDHPLDRYGRGDISLDVPREQWFDAQSVVDGLDLDDDLSPG